MGKVVSRCMKGCEGGKNEIGEENLESIIESANIPIRKLEKQNENENETFDITKKARSAKIQEKETERFPLDEKKCKIKIKFK